MSKEAEQLLADIKAMRDAANKIFEIVDETPMHLAVPALTLVLAGIGLQLKRDSDYPKDEYLEHIYDSVRDAYDRGFERLEDE